MTSISVTVHTAAALDGWTQAELDALDVLATEAKLARLLVAEIRKATGVDAVTVEVRRDDDGDFWSISGAESAKDELALDEAVRDTLMDFPWHDGQHWGEFRYLVTADGRRVY